MDYNDARKIVQAELDPPLTTAPYGAHDATGFWVPYGLEDDLAGRTPPDVVPSVMPEVAAVVDKGSGRLEWLPYTAEGVMDRLDAMEELGDWPS